MKKFTFLSAIFIFSLLSVNNSVPVTLSQPSVNVSFQKAFLLDDVTSRYVYLVDNNGYKYGADFYVKNNSKKKLRVFYSFSGGSNVFVSYNGGYADLNPGAEEFAARVTAADPTKAWDSGTFNYEWQEID